VSDPTDRRLVHGDYGIQNVLFSRATPPELVGVLDWERAGVGDPLVDLGWLLATWFDDSEEVTDLPVSPPPRTTPTRPTTGDRLIRIAATGYWCDRPPSGGRSRTDSQQSV
jgi:aminoglycoside phosphotransferase (APT) family kinase protein